MLLMMMVMMKPKTLSPLARSTLLMRKYARKIKAYGLVISIHNESVVGGARQTKCYYSKAG